MNAAHNIYDLTIELYSWNLLDFFNQYHHNKEKKKKENIQLTKQNLKFQFLSCTSHILSALKPHMSSGCH